MSTLAYVFGKGLLSARPAASVEGRFYYATDTSEWTRDNGATWDTLSSPGAPGADGADGLGVPAGGTTGQALVKIDNTDNNTEWSTISASPGGTDTQVQFNDSSAFGGDSGLTFDKTTDVLSVTGGITLGSDLLLARDAAATLRLGAADAAAAVAQTICVQDVVAGTSNTSGAALTICGSLGTGNATPAKVIIKLGRTTTSGTTQQPSFNAVELVAYEPGFDRPAITLPAWSMLSCANLLIGESVPNFRSMIHTDGFRVRSTSSFSFQNDPNVLNGATDLALYRDGAAGTLAQRLGTAAQTFRLYNTYTDASNYERAALTWSSNVCYLKAENAGTGAARLFVPVTGSTTVASLPTAATAGAGARAFVTDATATTFLSTAAGGGANAVPVVSDGTNWLIG